MAAMKAASAVIGLLVTGFLASIAAQPSAARYDLLIRNARVLDGTGNPWFPADIAVQGGRIVAVGPLPNAAAARIIDAAGKYVIPGLWDMHVHIPGANAFEGLTGGEFLPVYVAQGVTGVRDMGADIVVSVNLLSRQIRAAWPSEAPPPPASRRERSASLDPGVAR